MSIKVSDAKITASIIKSKVEELDKLLVDLENEIDNPDVRKVYDNAEAKIEALRDVYMSLHGNHVHLKI